MHTNRIREHREPPEPEREGPYPLVLESDRLCDWPTAVGILAGRLDLVMTALRTLTLVTELAAPGEATSKRADVLAGAAEFGHDILDDDGWISDLYTGPSPTRN